MEKKKEVMKQVWNDIFNNEHCTCRDFEDYWNWKKSERIHPNSSTTFDNSTIDDLSELMEKKINKEEFNFRIKCIEKCLEDIKNNDEPLRSLFDICIASDLDDQECLDWFEGFNK